MARTSYGRHWLAGEQRQKQHDAINRCMNLYINDTIVFLDGLNSIMFQYYFPCRRHLSFVSREEGQLTDSFDWPWRQCQFLHMNQSRHTWTGATTRSRPRCKSSWDISLKVYGFLTHFPPNQAIIIIWYSVLPRTYRQLTGGTLASALAIQLRDER